MPILKDLAQVLRIHEQGNSSLVLVLLGRQYGQMRVHAKGAQRWSKRGFAGGFDLLVRGEILVYPRPGEGLWILKEWEERARPRGLGTSWRTFHAAAFLCEFAAALTRETAGSAYGGPLAGAGAPSRGPGSGALFSEENNAALYDLLAAAAEALTAGARPGPVILSFVLPALATAGLLPDLAHCSACGRELARLPGDARLDAGGLHCESCAGAEEPAAPETVAVTPEALAALRFIQRTGKEVRLSRPAAAVAARALSALIHTALEHDLRTLAGAALLVRELGAARGQPARAAEHGKSV